MGTRSIISQRRGGQPKQLSCVQYLITSAVVVVAAAATSARKSQMGERPEQSGRLVLCSVHIDEPPARRRRDDAKTLAARALGPSRL